MLLYQRRLNKKEVNLSDADAINITSYCIFLERKMRSFVINDF